jgi:hypothetical protein
MFSMKLFLLNETTEQENFRNYDMALDMMVASVGLEPTQAKNQMTSVEKAAKAVLLTQYQTCRSISQLCRD